MKNYSLLTRLISIFVFITLSSATVKATAQSANVRGVLFFSPSCPHCINVIHRVLPPIMEKYGEQLTIANIDVGTKDGQTLYKAAIEEYTIPEDRIGVPTLIMGNFILVGAQEIPNQLAGLIEKGLASGGVDWPSIPGLDAYISTQKESLTTEKNGLSTAATPESAPQIQDQSTEALQYGFAAKFAQDRVGNTIAVILLVLMILAVIWVVISFLRGSQVLSRRPRWAIPALAAIGIFIAGYMSYIEISQANAICGPIGDCNAVQRSSYATLFGFLPVGILGLIGYAFIGATWLLEQFGPNKWNKLFRLIAWGFGWIGILFSIYLTFLEPFVIGATCAWCISSAIVITLIFLTTTGPAIDAMHIEEDEET